MLILPSSSLSPIRKSSSTAIGEREIAFCVLIVRVRFFARLSLRPRASKAAQRPFRAGKDAPDHSICRVFRLTDPNPDLHRRRNLHHRIASCAACSSSCASDSATEIFAPSRRLRTSSMSSGDIILSGISLFNSSKLRNFLRLPIASKLIHQILFIIVFTHNFNIVLIKILIITQTNALFAKFEAKWCKRNKFKSVKGNLTTKLKI